MASSFTFDVKGQVLKEVDGRTLVSDSINFLDASFTFDDAWDIEGLVTTAHFRNEKGEGFERIIHDGKILNVEGINLTKGEWRISVLGEVISDGGDFLQRITTTPISVYVVDSEIGETDPFPDITPTIGEVIVSQAKAEADRAEESAGQAAESAGVAEMAANNASLFSDNAKSQAERAESAENDSKRYAEDAKDEAEAASFFADNAFNNAQEAKRQADRSEASMYEAQYQAEEAKRAADEAKHNTYDDTEVRELIAGNTEEIEKVNETTSELSDGLVQHQTEIDGLDTRVSRIEEGGGDVGVDPVAREGVSRLSESIDEIADFKMSANLLDLSNPLVNKSFRSSGYIGNTEGQYISNIVNVEGAEKVAYVLNNGNASDMQYSFSSVETFASGTILGTGKLSPNTIHVLNVPDGAKFFAIALGNSSNYEMAVKNGTLSQIQINDGITEYPPFGQKVVTLNPNLSLTDRNADSTIYCIENETVKDYIDSVSYADGDYSSSKVGTYYNKARDEWRKDFPYPCILKWEYQENALNIIVQIADNRTFSNKRSIILDGKEQKLCLYNLIPSKTYFYRIIAVLENGTKLLKEKSFTTSSDHVRMLKINGRISSSTGSGSSTSGANGFNSNDGLSNFRDIGGWNTSINGYNRVKYNKIIRGCEFSGKYAQISESGISELLGNIGITVDIDFRTSSEGAGQSALGNQVDYLTQYITGYATTLRSETSNLKTIFDKIFSSVSTKSIVIHCQGGNDRTGTIAFLISGLLGVSEENLSKDYELSSFVGNYQRNRNSNTYDYKGMVTYIKTFDGTTLAEKFASFFTSLGYSQTDIDTFRSNMLE